MSKRDWSGAFQALGLSLAILVALGFSLATYAIGYGLGKDHYSNEYSGNYHDNYAADRIGRECELADSPPVKLDECIQKQIEASVEYKTAYADLKSQERMAFWTMLMGLFTGLTVLVTGVGVAFVARTLRATTDTVGQMRVANTIMRSEQRPWLTLERELGCIFDVTDVVARLSWKSRIVNLGKNPAFSVRSESKIARVKPFQHSTALDEFIKTNIQKQKMAATFVSIFPSEKSEYSYSETGSRFEDNADDASFVLFNVISYRLWNDKTAEAGFDVRVYDIVENDGRAGDIEGSHLLIENRNERQTT